MDASQTIPNQASETAVAQYALSSSDFTAPERQSTPTSAGFQNASNHATASPTRGINIMVDPATPASIPLDVSQATIQPKSVGTTTSGSSNPVPRLRSSIACARCRKSKIKCTNAGAGTTCEACAHSNRECVYPAPGTGGAKREGDAEESGERIKRSRARKLEPSQTKANAQYLGDGTTPESGRSRGGLHSHNPQSSIMISSVQVPTLSARMWSELFDLFQLHYGIELSFLHAPTFLPRLVDDAAVYAALIGAPTSQGSISVQLLQLGILALTARQHDGLLQQFSPQPPQNGAGRTPIESAALSESFANALKVLLFQSESDQTPFSLEQPNLTKVQALLMLSLYEWTVRRGASAWMYLGLAIRMAQVLDILSLDMEIPEDPVAALTGALSSALVLTATESEPDLESSEAFVSEETIRRTVWSCFVLDRYFSNGTSRTRTIDSQKVFVQLPCGEKAWAFGDRVCTPLFNGDCSHQKDRTRRRYEQSSRKHARRSSTDTRPSSSMVEGMISRISCECGQDGGLTSRIVRLTDLWSNIAEWAYQGGKSSDTHPPWDERSKYWKLKTALQKFADEMPRSFRLTKVNSQAHLAQHTSPSFTLLHTIYSICKLILLREFLPFAPVKLTSPAHLDETEVREPNVYNRRLHSHALLELFKVAHDFLELIQTCKARSLLPVGPMMGFGIYLVSLIGIYALHFPHMDAEASVFGKALEPNVLFERQVHIIEALQILASLRNHSPMAEYWFRFLHRAHRYYRQANAQHASEASFGETSEGNIPSAEGIRSLDALFKDFGEPEDESAVFIIHNEPPMTSSGYGDQIPSPQPVWQSVNAGTSAGRFIDPLDRPAPAVGPQLHGKWYPPHRDPVDFKKSSPGFEHGNSYPTSPHNTLAPINAVVNTTRNPYPRSPPLSSSPTLTQTQSKLFYTGEDVGTFLDARSDKELATIRRGWEIVREGRNPLEGGSPNHRAQETKKILALGAGWVGVIWQW